MIFRLFFTSILFLSFVRTAPAQAREESEGVVKKEKRASKKGFDSDRLRFGGSFGASFGQVTFVELSPTIGYLVKDYWLAGVGGRYMFYEDNHPYFYYKTNIYGGSVFNQFYLLENIILHGEVETLNLDDRRNIKNRVNVTSVFVGGGYRSMISDRAFASILLLYNINESYNSPYTNPILRISFGFGL
ncbi:MAG: hypothetical protein WD530_07980 [Vicingaceae bacterium]